MDIPMSHGAQDLSGDMDVGHGHLPGAGATLPHPVIRGKRCRKMSPAPVSSADGIEGRTKVRILRRLGLLACRRLGFWKDGFKERSPEGGEQAGLIG